VKLCLIADGRSIHTQRWAEYFGKHHEVHLVTYDPSGRSLPGVTEHVIPSPFRNLYLGFWPRHLRIRRLVNRIGPDLVHAHFISKYGFHLPFLGPYPKIVSAWGDDVLVIPAMNRVLAWYTRLALEEADLVYAISGDIRAHITGDLGVPPEKVKFCPFGVDTGSFSPGPSRPEGPDQPIRIFSNRGFLPIYGMETLVLGFSLAHAVQPRIHLTLRGEGEDRDRMMELARERGLGDAITFLPRASYDQVPEDLRGSDIYVTPAGRDGTPVSLLEAMATGLPCIGTAVGGIPEWIVPGENGMLVPPWNPRAIAESILFLAGNGRERARLGANARRTICERGDWNTLMGQVEEDYRRIISSHGS
jgi:glycosyltransferase involved in cell wall biosynthesis